MARNMYTNPMNPTTGPDKRGNGSNGFHVGGLKPTGNPPSGRMQGGMSGNNNTDRSMRNPSSPDMTRMGLYNTPDRSTVQEQPAYMHGSTDCVYAIRSIRKTDLTNYGFFQKLGEGIPFFCNVKYNMTLVETGSGVHRGSGQQLNAVIYGEPMNSILMEQDLVRVRGTNKRGVFVIKALYSENYRSEIRINRHWKNPDKVPLQGNTNKGPVALIFIGLLILLALSYFGVRYLLSSGGLSLPGGSSISTVLSTALIIGILIVGLYLNRFQIFRNKTFMIIFFITIGILVAKYIPGGEGLVTEIATLVITVWALIWMVKSVFK